MKISQKTTQEIMVELEKHWKKKKDETNGYKVKRTLIINGKHSVQLILEIQCMSHDHFITAFKKWHYENFFRMESIGPFGRKREDEIPQKIEKEIIKNVFKQLGKDSDVRLGLLYKNTHDIIRVD